MSEKAQKIGKMAGFNLYDVMGDLTAASQLATMGILFSPFVFSLQSFNMNIMLVWSGLSNPLLARDAKRFAAQADALLAAFQANLEEIPASIQEMFFFASDAEGSDFLEAQREHALSRANEDGAAMASGIKEEAT